MDHSVGPGRPQGVAQRLRVANVELGRDRVVQHREQVRPDEPLPAGDEHDEFIRDYTTVERLAARPDQSGTTRMTAGNSSPLTDGVSAIVIASGEKAAELAVTGVCIGSGQGIARVIGNPQP